MSWRNLRGDRHAQSALGARVRSGLRQPLARIGQTKVAETEHEPAATSSEPDSEQPQPGGEDELGHDQATYSCSCGFVFEAPVSASVDCPHCGAPQAW